MDDPSDVVNFLMSLDFRALHYSLIFWFLKVILNIKRNLEKLFKI